MRLLSTTDGDGAGRPDSLKVLTDALERNATSWRRRGLNPDALAQEQTLVRLRKAMAKTVAA